MERLSCAPRPGWERLVTERGLTWHTPDTPYWAEGTYYRFTSEQVDLVERATNELHQLCIEAAGNIIDNKRYAELKIPEAAIPLIERSWNEEPPSIYGRFDLAYDGSGTPKMLEYNADTPTALLESSVIQWDWKEARFPRADQFNGIHEYLVECWREFQPYFPRSDGTDGHTVHFTAMDNEEDRTTVAYLADTAEQAGLRPHILPIAEVGWNEAAREFRDEDDQHINTLFKLYPWEWIMSEPFAEHIRPSGTMFMEPAWKMLISNKGILPILWELFPDSPYLVPAFFDDPGDLMEWVRKPLLSREGSNVTIHSLEDHVERSGSYGAEGFVFQEFVRQRDFDGNHPVIGSWIIGQEAKGMGIRESSSLVTDNLARFVPHIFEG